MSFSFGFTNQDLDNDEIDISNESNITNPKEIPNALSSFKVSQQNLPVQHSLSSILSTLKNVRISFDNYTTPGGNIIYRRELFDVKHQIMSEDENNNILINDLLIHENHSDLKSNIYEGGFKSWECAYDTVDELSKLGQDLFSKNILEMGCGTSLPSSYIILKKLENKNKQPLKLILSDFNFDVLRLVTIPNLVIHWASTIEPKLLYELTTTENDNRFNNDELLITEDLINRFEKDLDEYSIDVKFISGSWGNEFNQMIEKDDINFIISSETIYSPEMLPIIAESINEILEKSNYGYALIAAKNIYFGVGGSIIEFLNYMNSIQNAKFEIQVKEINDSQLKRSIINIKYG
ncbi:unnamed protein product [Candida verbasci]|uniref:protein-histidine N-methyltransferase n=1 Tax=Candida verbasci TaxID=1227364 RepID=A0A9W4TUL9_9ASCO|nr:unnamed protein product [Candida verbasci]